MSNIHKNFNSRTREGATKKQLGGRIGLLVSIHAPVWVRLGVVLQGQPNKGTCVAALVGMYAGLIKAALSDTPGTINAGTPVTITANGTWKAAASGDTVYARVIHAQWEQGLVEIGFVPSYQVAAA